MYRSLIQATTRYPSVASSSIFRRRVCLPLSSSSSSLPWHAHRVVTIRTLHRQAPTATSDDGGAQNFEIPRRIKQKVVTAEDAVSLVQPGDTVAISGFVCQGCPEGILRALAARYEATGLPNNLTIFFGGGPGDWEWRGLNHLALHKEGSPPMLARTIGSHYGQVPKVAARALANEVEAWTLPMGSVSRMWRAQSTRSPGHLTTVGLGTYMVSMLISLIFIFIWLTKMERTNEDEPKYLPKR